MLQAARPCGLRLSEEDLGSVVSTSGALVGEVWAAR